MFVRSLIAYQGNKWSLLRNLWDAVGSFSHFHDVFGGSAVVALNMVSKNAKVYYNDHDTRIFEIFKVLQSMDCDNIIRELDKTIKKHGLSRADNEAYLKFREHYNKKRDPFLLWVLSKHSFSSLIRFSDNGFNMPFGRRSPEKSSRRDFAIEEAHKRLRKLKLHNLSYLKYMEKAIKKADSTHVFYFDPPYLASGDNVYEGSWTETDEIKLLQLLDYMDRKGLRWMLSNVTHHRQHKNKILIKWLRDRNYTVIKPKFNKSGEGYILNRATTSDANNTKEVLVKNY